MSDVADFIEWADKARKAQAAVDQIIHEGLASDVGVTSREQVGHRPGAGLFDQDKPAPERFYVTFGLQYARKAHPLWPKAHPDGVLLVRAKSYQEARAYVLHRLGTYWSDLVPASEIEIPSQVFPFGVLDHWDVPDSLRYVHPQGKTIIVWADGTMECRGRDGKRANTTATPDVLERGYGKWTLVP